MKNPLQTLFFLGLVAVPFILLFDEGAPKSVAPAVQLVASAQPSPNEVESPAGESVTTNDEAAADLLAVQ